MAGLQGREDTLTRELPGGWRQRLALGCAILHEPRIVFLDEPTGGVDPLSRRRFWDLIGDLSRQGVTVLVTTHYLDEAEHCHRIAIIQAGKLAALGTATELKQVFSSRPIVEIHASQPVQAMAILDKNPQRREDQPVRHLRSRGVEGRRRPIRRVLAAALKAEGIEVVVDWRGDAVARRRLPRRGRTRGSGVMRKTLAVAIEGAAADPARSAIAADPAVRAGVLPAAVRLRAQLRHPQRDAGGPGPGSQHEEPRAGVVVRQLRLLLAGRLRRFAVGARSPGRSKGSVRAILSIPAGFERDLSLRQPVTVQVIIDGDNANTASTVMGYAQNADRRVQLRADAGAR